MKILKPYGYLYILIGIVLISFYGTQILWADGVEVHIKGFDDGIQTTRQQDYKEAVLFAKRDAIERAGVKVKSLTTVEDFVANSDYIESTAEAVLLPGFSVLDVGYQKDGTYLVILSGKIQATGESGLKTKPGAHPGLNALANTPDRYLFYIGDHYGYHNITDAYFIADDNFVINYTYKNGQIILKGVTPAAENLNGTYKTDESSGNVKLSFKPDGSAMGSWHTFMASGGLKIERK